MFRRYMEEITSKHHSDKLPWMKTIQGVATGIQCIGELPFLFFSGWIIKRVGHWYCMTLGFLVYSIRFYLYSVITNPLWILPVELFNGITYGLCHAVLIAYARIIAPPSTATTLVGFSGALFEGVGECRFFSYYFLIFVFSFIHIVSVYVNIRFLIIYRFYLHKFKFPRFQVYGFQV